ncbi:MAG: type II secretion system F family protein [Coriobacteriia bacterium]|nr:type II secretion system F family protein [Coriobacteriia bacterium]
MVARYLFGAVAALSAFVLCLVALPAVFAQVKRWRLREASGFAADGMRASDRALSTGIRPLHGVAAALLKFAPVAAECELGVAWCASRGVFASPQALCSLLAGACLVAFAVGGVIGWSPLVGLVCAVLVVVLAVVRLHSWNDARNDAVREAVPEALQSMEACSQSGFSLMQLLQQVAAETPSGLRELFERSAHILQAGGTSTQALDSLRAGSNVPELAFVAVALDVQHQTGGSMRQVLEAARDMVESELELRRSLKVQTAQARLSARVVTVMPFVMIALLSLLSKDFLAPFFQSFAGVVTLVVALAMQVAGVLLVRKMLKVGD